MTTPDLSIWECPPPPTRGGDIAKDFPSRITSLIQVKTFSNLSCIKNRRLDPRRQDIKVSEGEFVCPIEKPNYEYGTIFIHILISKV